MAPHHAPDGQQTWLTEEEAISRDTLGFKAPTHRQKTHTLPHLPTQLPLLRIRDKYNIRYTQANQVSQVG